MAALLGAIDQAEDEKQEVEKKLDQLQISRDDFLREVEKKFEEMQKTKEQHLICSDCLPKVKRFLTKNLKNSAFYCRCGTAPCAGLPTLPSQSGTG